MFRTIHKRAQGLAPRLTTALIAVAGLGLTAGCSDEVEVDPALEETGNELPALARMAEIRIAVEPRDDEVFADPQVEVDAHFVEYRDIASDDAALRAGLMPVASDILRPGQCMASSELGRFGTGGPAEGDSGVGSDPEVMLLDVGNVRVTVGEREYVVPVALVPDLVPWVSGVEYTLDEDALPRALFAPDGTAPVFLEIDGAPDAGLPAFDAQLDLPRAFELIPDMDPSFDGALLLGWQPSEAGDERMILELQTFGTGEATGNEVTCVVPDVGAATLPLSVLEQAGLGNGETVSVTARRVTSTYLEAGDFRRVRVVGEVRDRQLVAMPE